MRYELSDYEWASINRASERWTARRADRLRGAAHCHLSNRFSVSTDSEMAFDAA